MMRALFLVALIGASVSAQAQVYKCVEGGTTIYAQEPCGRRAQEIDATPATGRYDAAAHAQRRAQNARIELQQGIDDIRLETNRKIADRQRSAERSEKERRCAELRSRKQDAEYWSKEFRHPENVRREQDKAKKGASDLWWECGKLD
jgi:hypothetical protein